MWRNERQTQEPCYTSITISRSQHSPCSGTFTIERIPDWADQQREKNVLAIGGTRGWSSNESHKGPIESFSLHLLGSDERWVGGAFHWTAHCIPCQGIPQLPEVLLPSSNSRTPLPIIANSTHYFAGALLRNGKTFGCLLGHWRLGNMSE